MVCSPAVVCYSFVWRVDNSVTVDKADVGRLITPTLLAVASNFNLVTVLEHGALAGRSGDECCVLPSVHP